MAQPTMEGVLSSDKMNKKGLSFIVMAMIVLTVASPRPSQPSSHRFTPVNRRGI